MSAAEVAAHNARAAELRAALKAPRPAPVPASIADGTAGGGPRMAFPWQSSPVTPIAAPVAVVSEADVLRAALESERAKVAELTALLEAARAPKAPRAKRTAGEPAHIALLRSVASNHVTDGGTYCDASGAAPTWAEGGGDSWLRAEAANVKRRMARYGHTVEQIRSENQRAARAFGEIARRVEACELARIEREARDAA